MMFNFFGILLQLEFINLLTFISMLVHPYAMHCSHWKCTFVR